MDNRDAFDSGSAKHHSTVPNTGVGSSHRPSTRIVGSSRCMRFLSSLTGGPIDETDGLSCPKRANAASMLVKRLQQLEIRSEDMDDSLEDLTDQWMEALVDLDCALFHGANSECPELEQLDRIEHLMTFTIQRQRALDEVIHQARQKLSG